MSIRAVISDFGGVLTTPLVHSFMAFQDHTGISFAQLGEAMARIAERTGEHPLYELERGRTSEDRFLAQMSAELATELGFEPEMHRFKDIYFEALNPNEAMIEFIRGLCERGFRTAMLTNNVREWEPLWRSMLPVDEIFELVVDSAFVGMRKPERGIYELTLERLRGLDPPSLAGLRAGECLFIDDFEHNVEAARALGLHGVHFRETGQAIDEIRSLVERRNGGP